MKIVLDLQGAQSHSRFRGIGRYTLSMAKAFAAEAGHHELWLALNGRQDESSNRLVEQFSGLVPRERMLINELPPDIAGCLPGNYRRVQIAAAVEAGFLAGLQADCIWHSSLFEGWGDDSTAALGSGIDDHRRVATLYDLIPLLNPSRHLHDAAYRRWYYQRLGLLKRCGLLLAISESSRREAIDALQIPEDDVAVVFGAADPVFRPLPPDAACWARWQHDWRLQRGFVLYAGGYDAHKNIETLIAAFAEIPADTLQQRQLVLAGRCDEVAKRQLRMVAHRHRLAADRLVFTGALTDEQLTRLYSGCTLFVAPSLHEGLGLPPLEAMACGAAVIGSNVSSLPEVIGRKDALFDPRSRSSIAAKLQAALTDADFLAALRAHAGVQARQFTWPVSARRALAAIESHARRGLTGRRLPRPRPRLFHVSPLPPVRSGIADYSARLLRELATHYEIEVVIEQPELAEPWVSANFPIRSLQWFMAHAGPDDRILYHFGNSPFHAHMFGMLRQFPGVVVLHDSWLGAARNWMEHDAGNPVAFLPVLYDSHGYAALLHDVRQQRASTLDAWPVNRDVIEAALGVIVHSRYAVGQARLHFGAAAADKFIVVPFPKQRTHGDRRLARHLLGIGPEDFVVCSFGMLAPTKLNHRLLAAWLQSSLAADRRCRLVFVGENDGGDYGRALASSISAAAGGSHIQVTGFVSADSYADYLAAADVVVQLRTDSRGETSAAIFDALAHGLPLIVNAHGTASELPEAAVLRIPDRFSDPELSTAMEGLRNDVRLRVRLAHDAARVIAQEHHPADVALRYREAIEHFVGRSPAAEQWRLQASLQRRDAAFAQDGPERQALQQAVAANRRLDRPHLYVDVTAIARHDLNTGIQRVVNGVLSALMQHPQTAYRIEPVRLQGESYRLATRFTLKLCGLPPLALPEAVVQPRAGDILLGLDWVADTLPVNIALLDAWRVRGVRMLFVVYDLLPVRHPEWFTDDIAPMHARWLQCIGAHADALLCISRSVADDVRHWFDEHPPQRRSALPLGYFHLGSDPAAARSSMGLPADAAQVLARLRASPAFLMVGTMEPRKGHALVLDAFERLWAEGIDVILVVVGRQGWMSDTLVARMRSHGHAGTRLIWLEQASDEYLEQIYGSAHALVAASEAEGFGLPLVEAARHGLPVIARDIPVFREVSEGFARYFDGSRLDSLVEALRQQMAVGRVERTPDAPAILSWQDTTGRLWDMLSDEAHAQWLPPWLPRTPTAAE